MQVEPILTKIAKWDEFVVSMPGATCYHQYDWKEVIERSFGHQCHYLAAHDGGVIAGILPLVHMRSRLFGNFLVSLPFVNYGGLLCRHEEAEQALLHAAEQLRRSLAASHVELRHCDRVMQGLPTKRHKVTMILQLERDADSQWQAFNAKLRNQIRKAEKSCLTATIGHLELLDDFYPVFVRNMRDLGTPVYGRNFFHNVLSVYRPSTRIISVRHNGKAVAAGLAVWFRDTLEIPWASSIADFKSMCPNNLLYWEAIRFAIERGFSLFDFGRSTPHEGTYNFKKQWGAEPIQLNWQYLMERQEKLPEINPANPKYELSIRLWQRLPLFATRLLGPHIVKNIP